MAPTYRYGAPTGRRRGEDGRWHGRRLKSKRRRDDKGNEEGFDELKEGTEVVARTAGKGLEETGVAIGKVGKGSMKVAKGTIVKVDHDAKTVVAKTGDGTEKTFEFTEAAGKDLGRAVGTGIQKGAKVTVYYTEEAGKKIAHFFE